MLCYELLQDLPTDATGFQTDRLSACLEIHQLEFVGGCAPSRLLLRRNGYRGLKGSPSSRSCAVSRGISRITRSLGRGVLGVRGWRCGIDWCRCWCWGKQRMGGERLSSKRRRRGWYSRYERALSTTYGRRGKEVVASAGHCQRGT